MKTMKFHMSSRYCFLVHPWHNNICDIIICTTCIYFAEYSQNQIKSNQRVNIGTSIGNNDLSNN